MLIDTLAALENQSKFITLFIPETLDCYSRTASEQGNIPVSNPTLAKELSR